MGNSPLHAKNVSCIKALKKFYLLATVRFLLEKGDWGKKDRVPGTLEPNKSSVGGKLLAITSDHWLQMGFFFVIMVRNGSEVSPNWGEPRLK